MYLKFNYLKCRTAMIEKEEEKHTQKKATIECSGVLIVFQNRRHFYKLFFQKHFQLYTFIRLYARTRANTYTCSHTGYTYNLTVSVTVYHYLIYLLISIFYIKHVFPHKYLFISFRFFSLFRSIVICVEVIV